MLIPIPSSNSPDADFDALASQCTNEIGRGTTRQVFEIPTHPDKVLKVMRVASNYTNWAEMVVYHSSGDYRRYFAEVYSISWSGKFLVMERLSKVTWAEVQKVRHTFPRIINDIKPNNFGKDAAGAIKMLDYALVDLGPEPEIPGPTMLSFGVDS